MGILDRVTAFLGLTRAVAMPVDLVAPASILGRGPPKRGTRELLQAYKEQPWLRAVTSRIARSVATASWSAYARAAEPMPSRIMRVRRLGSRGALPDVGGVPAWRWAQDRLVRDVGLLAPDLETRARRRRELAAQGLLREIPDHPLLELLNAPNKDQTGFTSRLITQVHLDIKGEAFWYLDLDSQGMPTGFVPLPPHWVAGVPTATGEPFRVSFAGLQFNVPPERMIWLRDPDPEQPFARGTGVAEALSDELETDEYAAKYVKTWFFNGAVPSGIAAFEGASEPELKRAREKWEQEHQGHQRANRMFFANGKMNFSKVDNSFKDQQLMELRKHERDTIGQVFGMPPEILGIIENSNRSTIDAARFIFALGIEFPRCQFLRSELQHQLVPKFDGGDFCLEVEVPIPEDEQHRLDVMRAQPGAFSMNEWRGEAGYDAVPEFEGVYPSPLPGQQPAGEAEPAGTDDGDEEPEQPEEFETDDDALSLRPGATRVDPPWVKTLPR